MFIEGLWGHKPRGKGKKMKMIRAIFFVSIISLIFVFVVTLLYISSYKVVNIWDEAIYANNSLEMYLNNSYIVYTVNNIVDYYNTKPPLALYAHVFSYHIFGVSVFALRFSSYLSVVIILISILFFSRRYLNSITLGIIASIIYVTNTGVMRQHVFYTADLDAILCVLINFIVLIRLKQLVTNIVQKYEIYLMAALFALAYLTKSLSSLFILLPLVCSYIISNELVSLLKNKHTYFAIILFLLVSSSYYLIRIPIDDGYWKVVWESEYKRMFYNVMPWNTSPWYHYFQTLWTNFFKYQLILFVLFGTAYLLLPRRSRIFNKYILHLFLLCLGYLLFISIPRSKMDFYAAPLYTSFSFIIAFLIYNFFDYFMIKFSLNEYKIIIAVITLFIYPAYITTTETIKYVNDILVQERDAHTLRKVLKMYPKLKSVKILCTFDKMYERHYDVVNYYKKVYRFHNNTNVSITSSIGEITPGDILIVNQSTFKDSLKSERNIEILKGLEDVYLMTPIKR